MADSFVPDTEDSFVEDSFVPDASPSGGVENVQRVTEEERRLIRQRAPTPESAAKWLRDRGYEATIRGGDVAVRKPGDPTWGRVEPKGILASIPYPGKGFTSRVGEMLKDLTTDAADEYASLVAMAKSGGIAGAKGTAMGGPLVGLASTLAGAGVGAAGAEAARLAAAKAAGFDLPENIPAHLLETGVHGAAAEGLGKLAGKAIKVGGKTFRAAKVYLPRELRRPASILKTGRAKGEALETLAARQEATRAAETAFAPTHKAIRGARTTETAARAESKAADIEARGELLRRFEQAGPEVEAAIAKGRSVSGVSENFALTSVAQQIKGTAKGRISVPPSVPDAAWGITAEALKHNPEVGYLLRKHFGDEFVPVFEEGVKRGSHAMKARQTRLDDIMRHRGRKWSEQAYNGYIKDVADYISHNPKFTAKADPVTKSAVADAQRGLFTPESAKILETTFTSRLTGKLVTPRQAAAREALEGATLTRLERTAEAGKAAESVQAAKLSQKEASEVHARKLKEYRATRPGEATIGILPPRLKGFLPGIVRVPLERLEAAGMKKLGDGLDKLFKNPKTRSTAKWLRRVARQNPKKAQALFYVVTRQPAKSAVESFTD